LEWTAFGGRLVVWKRDPEADERERVVAQRKTKNMKSWGGWDVSGVVVVLVAF